MGRAAARGDDRQWLAQRLRLLPGFGAGLRRSLPRRDRASRSHRAGFVEESARMSCPRPAQGACARRRLCLRAREIAAERGRGGACQACAASPLARLARYVEAGGLRPFCGKPCGRFGRRPPCALSGPERQSKARLWQRLSLFLLLAGFAAALVLQAQPAFRALSLALVFIFLPVIALRVFAAYDLLRRAPSKPARPRIPDAELPLYTILVPLYREANMLAPLTARARAPRLSGGEARHQADPGSGRRRDDRGGARPRSPGQCRDRGGAGPSPAHQAKGAQLCAAARPRRISRHL